VGGPEEQKDHFSGFTTDDVSFFTKAEDREMTGQNLLYFRAKASFSVLKAETKMPVF
jgi:hypothetical protein